MAQPLFNGLSPMALKARRKPVMPLPDPDGMPPTGAVDPNNQPRAFAPSPQGSQNGDSGVTPGGQYVNGGAGANRTMQTVDTSPTPSMATGNGNQGELVSPSLTTSQNLFEPQQRTSPTAKKLFNDVPEDSHWENEAGTPLGTTHGGQSPSTTNGIPGAINKMFAQGSPLSNQGPLLTSIAEKHGIPADMFAAIITHETGHGTSNALVNNNNPGGMMTGGKNAMQLQGFDTLENGLNAMASNLKRNYFDKGLDTPEKIGPKYAPGGALNDPRGLNNSWVNGVSALQRQIQAAATPSSNDSALAAQ